MREWRVLRTGEVEIWDTPADNGGEIRTYILVASNEATGVFGESLWYDVAASQDGF